MQTVHTSGAGPTGSAILPIFWENISNAAHLDVGVGTDYKFVNTCMADGVSITLLDLEQDALDVAKAGLDRSVVQTLRYDILLATLNAAK